MCRACYAVVVAADADQQRLRRAAGLDVQVVAMTASLSDAVALDPTPDVLIVHENAADPAASTHEGPAVVWIGADAPAWADQVLADDAALNDALPGAVVRALIARRSR